MQAYFQKCQEKLGFVPNVLKAYAFDMVKLEAFVAMYNDLMLGPSGLSKLEREMIAVAVSSHNHCYYCLVAHGAAVRVLSGDPPLGEQMAMNYRAARLSLRQQTMLDFAVKLTEEPWKIGDADREGLRRAGFSERDIFDISAVAGFFNMVQSGRLGDRYAPQCRLSRTRADLMVRKLWFAFALAGCLVALALPTASFAQRAPEIDPSTGSLQAQSAVAPHGMVVSQEARATEIGVEILKRGGNAVDAAVAVGFALAVTLPRAGNLGGGGFMVIHLAGQDRPATIDYRETAPEATTSNVFLDENGNADPQKSRNSGLAVGVPGTVAGLALAHARYGSGKFGLAELIAPQLLLRKTA